MAAKDPNQSEAEMYDVGGELLSDGRSRDKKDQPLRGRRRCL